MNSGTARLSGHARRLARSAAFAGYTTGLLAAYELNRHALPASSQRQLRAAYKERLARDSLAILGVRWNVEGDVPKATRPRLVVANHRSALDIPLLLTRFDLTILSKADIAKWPILGRLARHGGTIFVDRESRASGAKALRQIFSAFERGETVCIFPEGTTRGGDEVSAFAAGAFAGVRTHGVEILPVGIAYDHGTEWTEPSFGAHLANVAGRPVTRVHAIVGAPHEPEGKAERIAEVLRDEVQALVHVARARLGR